MSAMGMPSWPEVHARKAPNPAAPPCHESEWHPDRPYNSGAAAGVIERLADAAVLTGAMLPVSVQLSSPVSGRQTWHGSMSGSARATIASSREMSPTRSG